MGGRERKKKWGRGGGVFVEVFRQSFHRATTQVFFFLKEDKATQSKRVSREQFRRFLSLILFSVASSRYFRAPRLIAWPN